MGPGGWGSHFRAFMLSVPADADLLKASNWTCSNRLARDPTWLDGKFGGWLEGNAVVTPAGTVVDLLRVDYRSGPEKAALVEISAGGKTASFDPKTGFVDFPGGCKKFTVRYDAREECYWSLANYVPEKYRDAHPERPQHAGPAPLARPAALGSSLRAAPPPGPAEARLSIRRLAVRGRGPDRGCPHGS